MLLFYTVFKDVSDRSKLCFLRANTELPPSVLVRFGCSLVAISLPDAFTECFMRCYFGLDFLGMDIFLGHYLFIVMPPLNPVGVQDFQQT